MGSISDFTNKISSLARPNLFEVTLGSIDSTMFVKASSVPSRQIASIPVKYLGLTIPIAGEATWQEWSCTVINDTNFTVREKIEDWMNNIRNDFSQAAKYTNLGYFDTIQIDVQDTNDFTINTYKLFNAFPISLGEIDLNWDTSDGVQEYHLTFAYSYYMRQRNNQ